MEGEGGSKIIRVSSADGGPSVDVPLLLLTRLVRLVVGAKCRGSPLTWFGICLVREFLRFLLDCVTLFRYFLLDLLGLSGSDFCENICAGVPHLFGII